MTSVDGIPGLTVDLEPRADGGWQIVGQHLGPGAPGGVEYEYLISIIVDDVWTFAKALGTDPAGVPAAWENRGVEVVREGETRWLDRHYVPHRFWSRVG